METQTGILRDSVVATNKAADAAEMSAKAAMGVAVPTLMLTKFAFFAEDHMTNEDFYREPQVRIEITNFGQSPAFLKFYDVAFTWEGLPIEPLRFPGYAFNVEAVLDAGKSRVLDEETTRSFGIASKDIAREFLGKYKSLKVYGYVSYGDIFGSPLKDLKFCKRLIEFDVRTNYWIADDADYPEYGPQTH